MRGYLKAWWLLAPLLTAALPTGQELKVSHALINFDINPTSDEINRHGTTLRLDILESTSPCGYGNVTLSGQSLAQDENGAGSGPVITDHGNTVLANWTFSCVHLEDEFQGQLMTFEVVSLDGEEAHDVKFVVQFQQMAPPSISSINGTVSVTETPIPASATDENLVKETSTPLDSELAELKSMIRQFAALEQAISSKVQHISETYDFKSPDEFHSFWRCDSLKCLVKTMYGRAKYVASRLYGHGPEGGRHFGGRPSRFGWRFRHGDRPHWFPHDGSAHGNHSCPHPRPHPHPPHPPHHQPPHGPPPHGPPPHGPPYHGPPYHEPPHFHQPPPFCHCAPPPPPHEFYEEQPPHVHPAPSHQILEDDMTRENLRLGAGPDNNMRPIGKFGDDKLEPPPHIIVNGADLSPPIPDHHDQPPHPDFRPHEGTPPHPHHGPHSEHRGPPPLPVVYIVAVFIVLALLVGTVYTRCFSASGKSRRSSYTGRCQTREARRQCRRNAWANRRAAIGTRYSEIVGWLRESVRRQEIGNEEKEKEAFMRQLDRSGNEEEDNISTTMEQEIAQFRAVASVVGDLVAAEEGRSHEYTHQRQQHVIPAPPSPASAFPDYASIDEELPAYDEGSNDSRFVADGFRYTPGCPYYTPSGSSTTESSLYEHLGRKD
ncbi:hypothetical protein F4813DRAFT_394224 [Daldinia decipiens]|uniref:uncharacterized protein n=1 Tax=Daldinia decipiens TaxID=326647 RepID=UPI0020C513A4|nr:uncharacterized protein F4813DRAFT_394224 [Daldinia decipiens]KAI1652875.1 hypothetical protein F4813DRAFT_394224 [Daldinia decipiens]